MGIFIQIESDQVAQVGDKIRIDAGQTFLTPDESAVSLFEIQPESAASFYNVTADRYLDWVYSSSGDKTVTVRVTTDGSPITSTTVIQVVTAQSDALWSNDQALRAHEDDILKFLPPGRSTWKFMHRRAQTLILADLDREGYRDINGNRYTKSAFIDVEEVRYWSTFLTLRLIFESLSNAVDDIFSEKAKRYSGLEAQYRDRVRLRLDVDGDGVIQEGEAEWGLRNATVVRV